jgi:opacity protein-like surface antigen
MRKHLAFVLVGLFIAATAATAVAADYDRYERGPRGGSGGEYAPPPPPPARGVYAPPPRHAQFGQPYFFGHLGIFSPNDDSDGLKGYDSGGNFDFGVGSRVAPMFAIDGTIGGYGAKRGSNEATVVPMTIGARLILPHPFIEPYVGGGLGLYFSKLDEDSASSRRGFTPYSGIDDTSTDFGGYLSAGLDMWLNSRVALNFEGKYNWVNPTFQTNAGNDVDVNMSGWTVNLGVRVGF